MSKLIEYASSWNHKFFSNFNSFKSSNQKTNTEFLQEASTPLLENTNFSIPDIHHKRRISNQHSKEEINEENEKNEEEEEDLNSSPFVIKRMHSISHCTSQWMSAVRKLQALNHPNLVKFYGYCIEEQMVFLIYEYMVNGSLDELIRDGYDGTVLNWNERVTISKNVACGLHYLHQNNFIHGNISSRNILLGKKMFAKLSDYSLPSIEHSNQFKENNSNNNNINNENSASNNCNNSNSNDNNNNKEKNIEFENKNDNSENNVHNDINDTNNEDKNDVNINNEANSVNCSSTIPYADPHLCLERKKESDVYAFGLILFELLTGRPIVQKNSKKNSNLESHSKSRSKLVQNLNIDPRFPCFLEVKSNLEADSKTDDESSVHLMEFLTPFLIDEPSDALTFVDWNLVDPRLVNSYSSAEARKLFAIAKECVQKCPGERPLMGKIAASLLMIDEDS